MTFFMLMLDTRHRVGALFDVISQNVRQNDGKRRSVTVYSREWFSVRCVAVH